MAHRARHKHLDLFFPSFAEERRNRGNTYLLLGLNLIRNSKLWNSAIYLATVFSLDLPFHSPIFLSDSEKRPAGWVSLFHSLYLLTLRTLLGENHQVLISPHGQDAFFEKLWYNRKFLRWVYSSLGLSLLIYSMGS